MDKRGTLVVSLDFEFMWGMLDCSTIEEYGDHILGVYTAAPRLLELFKKHGIHATWATVGFMFAENKEELRKYFPDSALLPTYTNTEVNPYLRMNNIADRDTKQYFFAPKLIKKISEQKGQEIGTHTFSHYYCRESGQTPEQFSADMQAALKIASDKGYEIKSVVLPRNQTTDDCTKVLNDLGFLCFRNEEEDWIHIKIKVNKLKRVLRLADVYFPLTGQGGYIPQNNGTIINLVGSRMYKPIFKPLHFMEKIKIHRIKKQMLNAAKNGLTFHLWWHPHNIGVKTDEHLKQLEEIFSYYDTLKEQYGMVSMNMQEAALACKSTE